MEGKSFLSLPPSITDPALRQVLFSIITRLNSLAVYATKDEVATVAKQVSSLSSILDETELLAILLGQAAENTSVSSIVSASQSDDLATQLATKQDLVFATTTAQAYADLRTNFPAATHSGKLAWVSGLLNVGNALFVSNGTRWVPINGRTSLPSVTIPMYVAPTFTGTTAGAVTWGTALGARIERAFVYFAANTLVAGQPAGWFPVAFSSTTAGIAYNNPYIPVAGTFPTWPASPTAFSGATPGGPGVTSAVTAFTFTMPGTLLGEFGTLGCTCHTEHNNTANNKTLNIRYGATNLVSQNVAANAQISGLFKSRNAGAANMQRSPNFLPVATSTVAPTRQTVDTSIDQAVNVVLTHAAAATDWIGITQADFFAEVQV